MRKLKATFALAFCALAAVSYLTAQESGNAWKDYGGGPENSHFFTGSQITKSNVGKLAVAWSYPYGQMGANPIIANGVMYAEARNGSLVALDAATGKEIWIHDGLTGMEGKGINYWESKDGKDRRLIVSINDFLQEIDATTGKSITSFGDNGVTDLRVGLGRDVQRIQSGTPGKVFENLIIMGSGTGEGYMSPPGDFRAYDVLTGKLKWQFHTVPHPGEPGYETWPKDAWKYAGGVNTWGELTVDPVKGLVFFPTGSATYDFYGADRIGSDLYADCLIALDARTGKLKWYFQMVHHDLWDYDNTSAPQLTTVMHNGKKVDVVAQAGKTGFLYVFDRETGKPLWPIEERKVPASTMPGEKAYPTQPFPTVVPPFARQKFGPEDINPWTLTSEEQEALKERLAKARNEGLFTPPGMTDAVHMPGNHGGSNWAGTSANPTDGTVYVRSLDIPAILRMRKVDVPTADAAGGGRGAAFAPADGAPAGGARAGGRGAAAPAAAAPLPPGPIVASGPAPGAVRGAQAAAGRGGYIPYPEGVEAPADRYTSTGYGLMPNIIKPPYSKITAYDLNKGTIKWQTSNGEGDDARMAALGVHNTGVYFQKGGILVTSTGLLFVAGYDGYVRALDADNGDMLWSGGIAPGGCCNAGAHHGVPAMYSLNGRQYLVMQAPGVGGGGRGGPGTPDENGFVTGGQGQTYLAVPDDKRPKGIVVFALPPNVK